MERFGRFCGLGSFWSMRKICHIYTSSSHHGNLDNVMVSVGMLSQFEGKMAFWVGKHHQKEMAMVFPCFCASLSCAFLFPRFWKANKTSQTIQRNSRAYDVYSCIAVYIVIIAIYALYIWSFNFDLGLFSKRSQLLRFLEDSAFQREMQDTCSGSLGGGGSMRKDLSLESFFFSKIVESISTNVHPYYI